MSDTFRPAKDAKMEVTVSSREFEIDRRLEELAAKILAGQASGDERVEHQILSKRRARLMQENSYTRLDRLRLLRVS
jgi:hypothetical protein